MTVLIKQASIIQPNAPFNGQLQDILIKDGIIQVIADRIDQAADHIVAADGLHASIGWMDIFSQFCDPGFEHRETLETGAKAAATGGFTDVLVLPNTQPAIHNKSQVDYILQKSKGLVVNLHPLGAITNNTDGKELAEMYDMQQTGAIAFTDGIHSIQSPDILLKALQYVLPFDGVVIQVPDDKSIHPQGLMHEGVTSTRLGLPGKPAIAEELMIARDIELVKYTNSKIHFTAVSTQRGIALIEQAKDLGTSVSYSVTPYHALFCDEDLTGYDTNLKVNPPLRTRADMMAVREALINGSADAIASHHMPQHIDAKVCEFEYAKNGMIGLETLFGAMGKCATEGTSWNITKMIDLLSVAPRKIFNLTLPQIEVGAPACITLFTPDTTYIFEEKMLASRSKNTPFIGQPLRGKVIGIVNGDQIHIN